MVIKGAGIVIVDPEGKILVTHRKPEVSEGGKWGVPGGVNKEGKTLLQTAIEKTLQEVNLKYSEDELQYLDQFEYGSEGSDVFFKIWIARIPKVSPEININTDGHDGYLWVNPEKLLERNDLMVGMYPILRRYLEYLKSPNL